MDIDATNNIILYPLHSTNLDGYKLISIESISKIQTLVNIYFTNIIN